MNNIQNIEMRKYIHILITSCIFILSCILYTILLECDVKFIIKSSLDIVQIIAFMMGIANIVWIICNKNNKFSKIFMIIYYIAIINSYYKIILFVQNNNKLFNTYYEPLYWGCFTIIFSLVFLFASNIFAEKYNNDPYFLKITFFSIYNLIILIFDIAINIRLSGEMISTSIIGNALYIFSAIQFILLVCYAIHFCVQSPKKLYFFGNCLLLANLTLMLLQCITFNNIYNV